MFDAIDPIVLARAQFAFTVSFHFIFRPSRSAWQAISPCSKALWLRTGKQLYIDLFRFWLKIFAVAFAMGVVSGIVMSYQFGTNWSVFSDKAGPVIGPLMAYEVLTAFFLEAGFLGVMLFGMEKVGRKLAFRRDLLVAVGTFISAFWILSANSWMQTPVGYAINPHGQFVVAGSWAAVDLQSELSLSPRPHRDRRLSDHVARGGCGRGVAFAARTAATRMPGRCSRWRCGWRRSSRRSRFSPGTSTGSTRWSISRPR